MSFTCHLGFICVYDRFCCQDRMTTDLLFSVLFLFPFQDLGPEFIRIIDEPLVVLELPGSIVVRS